MLGEQNSQQLTLLPVGPAAHNGTYGRLTTTLLPHIMPVMGGPIAVSKDQIPADFVVSCLFVSGRMLRLAARCLDGPAELKVVRTGICCGRVGVGR